MNPTPAANPDPTLQAFDGCTAVITGASAGLGAEFARRLAPHVRALLLVARRADRLEALAAECRALRPELDIRLCAADLAAPGGPEAVALALEAEGWKADVLINNAGLGDYGTLATSDPARLDAMLSVNLRALVWLTRALLPGMVARRRGWILQVSSVASLLPLPTLGTYAATKAFVTSFSEAVRMECRGSGVRVTALLPGPVDTEFSAQAKRPGEGGYVQLSPAFFKVPAGRVVREGLRALVTGRARIIPGWVPRVCMTLASALPMLLVRSILSRRGRL